MKERECLMSDNFKDTGDIEEIIAQVNKLKKEKEQMFGNHEKDAESAANSIAERNSLTERTRDSKSQMAELIAGSLIEKEEGGSEDLPNNENLNDSVKKSYDESSDKIADEDDAEEFVLEEKSVNKKQKVHKKKKKTE